MSDPQHDHDGGLVRDLPHFLMRRSTLVGLGVVGLGAVGAAYLGGLFGMGQAEPNVVASAADGTTCVQDPAETNGPFPADGTNEKDGQTVNALTQNGVVRQDITASFNGLTGAALGTPLTLDITLVAIGSACAPLAGHAIYIWHADANGHYSIYDLPDQNYLRGVGVTDAAGKLRFTTVFPGCYDGRWPHVHFEVFASLDTAVSGADSLLISQFALPEMAAAATYAANPAYPNSTAALTQVTLSGDMVFGDNTPEQIAAQSLILTGDPVQGYAATGTITIA